MGDVILNPFIRLPYLVHERPNGHSRALRVGTFKERAVCQTCATVLIPRHDTFTVTDPDGVEHVIHGAYVGPSGDHVGHLLPFHPEDLALAPLGSPEMTGTVDQDYTDEHHATSPSTSQRPARINAAAAAKGRSKDTPSRSPEARHAEYVRAKRRQAAAAREG